MANRLEPAVRFLTPASYRTTRWKNGLGETAEIAREPTGIELTDFDWRVSYAAVIADGMFSEYPGIERTIMVFEGNGMTLALGHGGSGASKILSPFVPFTYPGETPVHGQLLDGPVLDLNLMCRRDACSGTMRVVETPAQWSEIDSAVTTVIFAMSGPIEVSAGDDAAILAPQGSVILHGAGVFDVRGSPEAKFTVLRIAPK